jgi:hypothetical protein
MPERRLACGTLHSLGQGNFAFDHAANVKPGFRQSNAYAFPASKAATFSFDGVSAID